MNIRPSFIQAPQKIAVLDIETLAPPMPDGSFPPWPSHSPLVASVLTADRVQYGEWQFAIESIEFADDRAAIARIDELLAGRRCVSYNGTGFDLPILAVTAMRNASFECRNLADAWASHRYSGPHTDVAQLISGFGGAPRASLEMLCEAAGIPVKNNGHGGDVAEMLQRDGIKAVAAYCEEDVASTLTIFAMVQALRSNDLAYGASLICDFANWVVDAGHQHLDQFRALSGNAVLEKARLLHRVEEGLTMLKDRETTRFFNEPLPDRPLSTGQKRAR